ncbi:hypothetical protein BB558_003287 [Smittium angustum]|uniref:ERCC4 domain-containing protein n=1 Tax=Smittium angustum TaxID=133377 RepID=A0A2U1J6L9_SMIAN|nr:hypothetical protein BB558_003287 [Smittium angustum]
MFPLLDFQNAIVQKLLHEDALSILAQGLGHIRIATELVRFCATNHSLVLVINSSSTQEQHILQSLLQANSTKNDELSNLHIVNTDTNPASRAKIYLQGGVLFVTSRILLVDILNQNIPLQLVTGILVFNAHSVSPDGNDAFILKLYRDNNSEGFIKAISEKPYHFVKDFNQLEKSLKLLQLRTAHLWPRFEVNIIENLSNKIKVIEVRQKMSIKMIEAQQTILDCTVATVDFDEFEYSISTDFQTKVRNSLNPYWHRVNQKTKQLVNDLGTLRFLMNILIEYNCVDFNDFLESLLLSNINSNQSIFRNNVDSAWMLTDSGNLLFNIAKERVFRINKNNLLDSFVPNRLKSLGFPADLQLVLEPQSKWDTLSSILDDINSKLSKNKDKGSNNHPILIMVDSEYSLQQISGYLNTRNKDIDVPHVVEAGKYTGISRNHVDHKVEHGKYNKLLIEHLQKYFFYKRRTNQVRKMSSHNNTLPNVEPSSNKNANITVNRNPQYKRRRVRGSSLAASTSRQSSILQNTSPLELEKQSEQIANRIPESENSYSSIQNEFMNHSTRYITASDDVDEYYGLIPNEDLIYIRAYDSSLNLQVLEDLKPSTVIMYSPDIYFIRQLEIYQAQFPESDIEIHFLVYDNSIEEQKYLNELRREKEAFAQLVHTNSTMVIPLQQSGLSKDIETEQRMSLLRSVAPLNFSGNSSNLTHNSLGKSIGSSKLKVIVDMREFRSSLPFALYKSRPKNSGPGQFVDVVPKTLLVGDYILHDKCCVERKSVADLVQSLSSGRLYTQATSMSNYYEFPILLIEFNSNLSFSLSNIWEYSSENALSDVCSKLVMLIISFPKLRILWSPSPASSANYFLDLKENHPEPDVDRAVGIGTDESYESIDTQYNNTSFGILESLPGVGQSNAYKVANKVSNLSELCNLSLEEMQKLLGKSNGKELFMFVNQTN